MLISKSQIKQIKFNPITTVIKWFKQICQNENKLECGPMPSVMAALQNIGGALCSTPQSLADAHLLEYRAVTLPRRETRWN